MKMIGIPTKISSEYSPGRGLDHDFLREDREVWEAAPGSLGMQVIFEWSRHDPDQSPLSLPRIRKFNSGPPFVLTVLHPPLRKGGIAGPLN